MIRSLLVPLDGSVFSEYALPFALGIAKRACAAVQLLQVHVPLDDYSVLPAPHSDPEERIKEQEWAYLDHIMHRWQLRVPDVKMSTLLLEGLPSEVLLEETRKADLVVMSTHGRGPASRFWLGSLADALVRAVAVPLMLLRPDEQPSSDALASPFHHLMIPLDGSDLAEQALKPALQLGRLMEAKYTLLRVVKPVIMLDPNPGWPAMTDLNEKMTRQTLDEAQGYLDRIAALLRGQGLTVQTRTVLHTHPAEAILQEAKEQRADLLSLATHGRGGIRRLLLGSVADKVLRGSSIPMLVCRPRKHK